MTNHSAEYSCSKGLLSPCSTEFIANVLSGKVIYLKYLRIINIILGINSKCVLNSEFNSQASFAMMGPMMIKRRMTTMIVIQQAFWMAIRAIFQLYLLN